MQYRSESHDDPEESIKGEEVKNRPLWPLHLVVWLLLPAGIVCALVLSASSTMKLFARNNVSSTGLQLFAVGMLEIVSLAGTLLAVWAVSRGLQIQALIALAVASSVSCIGGLTAYGWVGGIASVMLLGLVHLTSYAWKELRTAQVKKRLALQVEHNESNVRSVETKSEQTKPRRELKTSPIWTIEDIARWHSVRPVDSTERPAEPSTESSAEESTQASNVSTEESEISLTRPSVSQPLDAQPTEVDAPTLPTDVSNSASERKDQIDSKLASSSTDIADAELLTRARELLDETPNLSKPKLAENLGVTTYKADQIKKHVLASEQDDQVVGVS